MSGVNDGPNYGDAYHYSGTVGAAFQSLVDGVPAIAISQDSAIAGFDFSVQFSVEAAKSVLGKPLEPAVLLGINIPSETPDAVEVLPGKGVPYRVEIVRSEDGQSVYYQPVFSENADLSASSDTYAYLRNSVTVTPLRLDRNAYDVIADVKQRAFVRQAPTNGEERH